MDEQLWPPRDPLDDFMLEGALGLDDFFVRPFAKECIHQPRLRDDAATGRFFVYCLRCDGESQGFRRRKKARRWWNTHFPQKLGRSDAEPEDVMNLDE